MQRGIIAMNHKVLVFLFFFFLSFFKSISNCMLRDVMSAPAGIFSPAAWSARLRPWNPVQQANSQDMAATAIQ